jgi:hypothetical protein
MPDGSKVLAIKGDDFYNNGEKISCMRISPKSGIIARLGVNIKIIKVLSVNITIREDD